MLEQALKLSVGLRGLTFRNICGVGVLGVWGVGVWEKAFVVLLDILGVSGLFGQVHLLGLGISCWLIGGELNGFVSVSCTVVIIVVLIIPSLHRAIILRILISSNIQFHLLFLLLHHLTLRPPNLIRIRKILVPLPSNHLSIVQGVHHQSLPLVRHLTQKRSYLL